MARRRKRKGRRSNLRRMPHSKCQRCGRVIFGGPKGMSTHRRKSCGKKRRRKSRR